MVFECQNCGAPLDVQESQRVVRCAYCGRSSAPEQLRLVHQQTPAGWAPPPRWTPPAEFPADSSQTLVYRVQRTAVLLSVLAGALICGSAAVIAALSSFGPRSVPPEPLTDTACPHDFDSTRELECECRPNDMKGSVWGSGIYTADSRICAAALHAGAVEDAGGMVVVRPASGCPHYTSSQRHGITSSSRRNFPRSFYFRGFGDGICADESAR